MDINVDIFNTAPYFPKNFPSSFSVPFNNTLTLPMPDMKDDEGHQIHVIVNPSYARTFFSANLNEMTTYCNNKRYIGTHDISI
jgi:hypothetical protein